jgi:ferredoxin-type protein NapG
VPPISDDKLYNRRSFLAENFKALGRLFADALNEAVSSASGGKRYHRPPGALDEPAFLVACTRCGDCVTACPSQAIKLLPPSAGAAVGTPYIDPLEAPCDLCGQCMPACGPKALITITDPRKVKMGTAVLDPSACWAHQGQICDLCYQRCPFPDEAIRMVGGRPEIIPAACTGCGLCVYACVSTPVALKIDPRR